MNASEGQKVIELFERLRVAIANLDAADRQRAKAKDELDAVEAEWRALARKGGS